MRCFVCVLSELVEGSDDEQGVKARRPLSPLGEVRYTPSGMQKRAYKKTRKAYACIHVMYMYMYTIEYLQLGTIP